ncbi:hypothetical protein Q7P35_002329 [Cladosporium inversicolor]
MPALPALAVSPRLTSKPVRQKYTDPPLQLMPSSTTAPPAMTMHAAAHIATSCISGLGPLFCSGLGRSTLDSVIPSPVRRRQFIQKLHEYRTVRRESRNGPPAIVNPKNPSCHHFNKWEHCYDAGLQCGAPECDRAIGSGTLFLLQCERCKLCACQRHQRKATTHSAQHQWGMTKEHNRKTFL